MEAEDGGEQAAGVGECCFQGGRVECGECAVGGGEDGEGFGTVEGVTEAGCRDGCDEGGQDRVVAGGGCHRVVGHALESAFRIATLNSGDECVGVTDLRRGRHGHGVFGHRLSRLWGD